MMRTEHKGGDWTFSFVAYEPSEKKDALPLVIQLHGAGERGDDLSLMDVHGFSHLLQEKDYPCLVIMPQCPKDTFWAARVESLVAFVEQLKAAYPVDPDRVYLTGLSMGGYGTWYTAMARPDLFAAIAPMCGGGMAWNAHTLTMPVWAFHGVDDPSVSVTQSDEMVERLKQHGRDVTYTRMDGVGHNVWQYGYTDTLMQWLLSHKRGEM